jgi:uncharacterized membrane protein YfcA
MPELGSILTIAFAFLLAGFVKGVIGMGLPTVSLGLLSLVMTPAHAAAILLVPSFVTNSWQLVGPNFAALAWRLWPMVACVFAGALLSANLLPTDSGKTATLWLGIALVIYAIIGLSAVRFSVPRAAEIWVGPIAGLVTGVITAGTGIFVIPALPYLQAIGLQRDDLVQALGIHFTVSTFAMTAVLAINGVLQSSLAGGWLLYASLAALVPALIGMYVGQIVRTRISPEVFRRFFFVGMLVLGAHLALRGFF